MTNAERLERVVLKFAGATHGADGANWYGKTDGDTRKVVVKNDDGEQIVGKGRTIAECVAQLEEKVGITSKEQ